MLPHHGRGKGAKRPDGSVQLVLQANVVLLLKTPPLFRSPVLKPNFNLSEYLFNFYQISVMRKIFAYAELAINLSMEEERKTLVHSTGQ